MTRAAALLLVVLLLVVLLLGSGCGGAKTPASAAQIAPADARAFLFVPGAGESALTRRALALSADGPMLLALVDRARWSRIDDQHLELVQLARGRIVAYARPADQQQFDTLLDSEHLAHTRSSGWTVFAPTRAALDASRGQRHLSETAWYRAAVAASGRRATTMVALRGRAWVAVAADGGTVRRSVPGRGSGAPQPLAADIPADAVVAAVSRDPAELLHSLSFAAQAERLLGLPLDDLARAMPQGATLYARAGSPIPSVTLLARGGTSAAAVRIVRDLAPGSPPAVRETVGGLLLDHVALGAVDLYYGRVDGTLVLTNDSHVALGGDRLAPRGLPRATAGWRFLDVKRAGQALEAFADLAGTQASVRRFARSYGGLSSLLSYTTREGGIETTTLVIRPG